MMHYVHSDNQLASCILLFQICFNLLNLYFLNKILISIRDNIVSDSIIRFFPECVSSDDDEDGLAELYEDPDNCGAFYECSHGIAYEMFCSEGLMYNTELEVCDYARNVDCGTRPVPSS